MGNSQSYSGEYTAPSSGNPASSGLLALKEWTSSRMKKKTDSRDRSGSNTGYSLVVQVDNHEDAEDASTELIERKSTPAGKKKKLTPQEEMSTSESLDYRIMDNAPQREFYQFKVLNPKDRARSAAKWLVYIMLGVVLGLLAVGIKRSVDFLQDFKFDSVRHFMNKDQRFVAFLVYFALNSGYALISCVVVLICGPLAGGSGIPEVKGYLNGVRVVHTINLKTFVGKVLSIIFAFSSCLALGPEGPMVHIGSMLGGGLAAAKSSTLKIRLLPAIFEKLRSHKDQRDFISSGAAAGIAAAFGAPIGGVLFALEEASSVWSRELTWRTFLGCMLSAFTVNLMFQFGTDANSLVSDYGLLSFGISRDYLYRYHELNLFILLGVIGGLLGTLFVKLNIRLMKWRREKIGNRPLYQLAEVLVVVGISACISFGLPALISCRPTSSIGYYPAFCDNEITNDGSGGLALINLYCDDPEQYNDFANLFILPQDRVLKLLFSRTHELFSMAGLNIFLIIYFALVTVTAGLSVSAGLFVPMLIIGATIGRIVGRIVAGIFSGLNPPIDTSIYALVGSAAMMAGFSRTTISLCVILIELTENTQFLLPIMLAVVCAKWVGDAFSKSIYDELMELKGIPFLETHPPHYSFLTSISDVMATNVVCINEVESLGRIMEIINTTNHNGFPVVKKLSEDRQKVYCGLVLRKQLLILLNKGKYQRKNNRITPEVLDYATYIALINHKWGSQHLTNLPPMTDWNDYVVDLRPYLDKSQVVVSDKFSYVDAYRLFVSQGLRHLPVVNENYCVVGMVTRHDLLSLNAEHEH